MFTTQIEPQALASGCEGHPVQVRLLGGAGWMCVLGVLALGLRLGTRDKQLLVEANINAGCPPQGALFFPIHMAGHLENAGSFKM